jgi:Family of unknown function (DUF5631)/Family of unknown function (DUF5632)
MYTGLWPAELDGPDPETTRLAEDLKTEMSDIAAACGQQLHALTQSRPSEWAMRAHQTRIITQGRALAAQRIDWTVGQLRRRDNAAALQGPDTGPIRLPEPAAPVPAQRAEVPRPSRNGEAAPPAAKSPAIERTSDDQARDDAIITDHLAPRRTPSSTPDIGGEPLSDTTDATEPPALVDSDPARIAGLLAYVAHQEPRVAWSIGQRGDGTYLLATDLAHGWIPQHITLPAGVRLLAPAVRDGTVTELLGDDVLAAAQYLPGDPLPTAVEDSPTPCAQARELPTVDDIGWKLTQATAWRDGLVPIAHTLAAASAEGTGISTGERDILSEYAADAHEQVLDGYPHIDKALLCNCLLLLALERFATGDPLHANYHYSWFQALDT